MEEDKEFSSFPMLDSRELSLLSHSLTHTSRVIAYDEEDFYVLHVGVPNLAFQSRPLMSSLLALSASCKIHDILSRSCTPFQNLDEIHELLVLGDKHRRASLRQIQASIPNIEGYDYMLANTTIMVFYASASHCIRVRLFELARLSGKTLPNELLPEQSQWISLIRAAYVAYKGLLNDSNGFPKNDSTAVKAPSWSTGPGLSDSTLDFASSNEFVSEDGPTAKTRELFYPIATSTYSSALEKPRAITEFAGLIEDFQVPPTIMLNLS